MIEPLWEQGALFAGKYRVETVLGRGGMGVVLGARHTRLDEPVAIKVLLPAMLETPGVVERFLREARAVAKIKSPHVVRVSDVDTLPSGLPFIVMERLDGVDLAALCKQKASLEIEEAVRYVVEACDALAEAHARGIVHRDLKPGNLFLARGHDGSSAIKVLDFGISKLAAESEEHVVTEAGVALGSPSYMSPEQMRSARDVDARTDIWALGAVLFRLLTGKTPFRADSLPQLYTLVTNATLQRPSELRSDIPPALEAVLVRCLEKDPARRYADVVELAEALLPFAGEGARAPTSRTGAITLPERSPPPRSDPAAPSSGPRSGEPEPAGDRSAATTTARSRTGFEASDSAQMTSAVRVRLESGSPLTTETPRPIVVRRGAARVVAVALALGLLAAGAGVRVVHHASQPIADIAAGSADATALRNLAAAEPSPPAASAPAAPVPSAEEMGSAPVVVPAATVVVSASASAAAPPKGRLPRLGEKKPPAAPAGDPFGGGRK